MSFTQAIIGLAAVSGLLLTGATAMAQTNTLPPATAPDAGSTPPSTAGGLAQGVVSPPRNVDPGMVTPPPANVKPSMPVIKPAPSAR